MIDAIIFSKNRAMQLHCVLDSMHKNLDIFNRIYVLYTHDGDLSKKNYKSVSDSFPDVEFWYELEFEDVFLKLVEISTEQIALFVDDDIIFRNPIKCGEIIQDDKPYGAFSLRLGINIKNQKHFDCKGSLDGTIFHKGILQQLKDKPFNNPNKLEIQLNKIMSNYNIAHYERPCVIGIPYNKVSNTSTCSHMGRCTTKLDIMYEKGYRIDWQSMDFEHNDVHKEIPYKFKKC